MLAVMRSLPVCAERPRVLFLMSSLVMGGSERKTVRLANALSRQGWTVHIAYLDGGGRSPRPLLEEIDPAVPVVCLERSAIYSPGAVLRLYRYLRTHRFERVVCINLYPLAYAAPLLRLPGLARILWLALVNNAEPTARYWGRGMFLYRHLLKRVDRVVFGCRYQRERWEAAYALDPRRSWHVYNGTDTGHFSPPSARPLSAHSAAGEVVIGTVGQLRPIKNQRELLQAASRLIGAGLRIRLMLVGEGRERPALEALAITLGIREQVEFLGQIEDVRPALARMDIFVLTSSSETFSNAALEAMAMRRAVVLTRVGGAPEMIRDGHDGRLYEPGCAERLAGILARLVENPRERLRLGTNARRSVERRFGFEQMVARYAAILGTA